MAEKQNTLFVGSLAKGLKLLRAFDETTTEMSLGELAARTGLDRSATQRLANTLHLEGMLEKDPVTRRFRPSHAWLQMAYAYFWSDPLVGLAMPRIIELSRRLGVTVNLAELSGDHIIYVIRIPVLSSQFSATLVGRRLPALSTSAGRAMLSTLPEKERDRLIDSWPIRKFTPRTTLDRDLIRAEIAEAVEKGHATTRDQMILNEVGIAAPITGPDGTAFASVHCSVSSHHWSPEQIASDLVPYLVETAKAIAPQSRGGSR